MSIFGVQKRVSAMLLLGVLLTVQALLFLPENAYAQATTLNPDVIASDQARDAIGNAKKSSEMSITGVIFTAIVNLLTFASDRLAYDAAVMLASGGPDEQPLIEYKSADAYFASYASAVAGQAVGLLSQEIIENGGVLSQFNLCAPSNPQILLSLKLGIRSAFRRPEPLCEFTDIKENWAGYIAEVASDAEDGVFKNELILTQLKDAFDPQTQEFSVGIQVYSDILGESLQKADIMKDKLLIQGPTKDVVDIITGNVKTPASFIDNDFFAKVEGKRQRQDQIMHSLLNNWEALLQVGISASSTFTNTLLSQYTNKLYDGFFDFDSVDTDPFDVGFSSSSTREDAEARFNSLLASVPLTVTDYDILGEFGSCPDENRGLYNCVADTTFITAIARAAAGVALTVQESLDEGLVDGTWPLIPSSDTARNQDTYCYTYGYCHSNLVKLRKSRIISVGWELAAESSQNSVDDPVTLQEVVDGYDDCNTAGERDDNHPWCRLIDPNWVLKYPETQCRALVYGQLLETSAASTRQEECVDMPSCIAEDENGTCTGGFGYCVREKNTWNFRGDSCPAYAASCLTFEDMDGENQSYLLTTVDYGSCDETSAGCLWYATEKSDDDGDGTYDWPTEDDVATADVGEKTYTSRIYLTAAVEECDEDEGGCAELYERTGDLRLNIIPNPSFEDDDDTDGVADAWMFMDVAASTYDTTDSFARSGDAAFNPGTGTAYQEGLTLEQGTTYTLSYYARQDDDQTGEEASLQITFANEDDAFEDIDLVGLAASTGCTVATGWYGIMEVNGTPESEIYERFECTLTTPLLADASHQLLAYVYILPGDVWVDDVQLEQGDDVSDYHVGYSDTAETVIAKVAPSYLGCTGSETDPDACESYAQVCRESEAGCTEYSPSNGDPSVFGIADDTDACPSTCVGYDTFMQEATLYEPDGDFPVYFIPESGDECDESSVGCDEFTKLDDESLAYFTYVRACVTSAQASANPADQQSGTFYTWEGSDLDGYQLKTWTLLESDMDAWDEIAYTNSLGIETDPGAAPCTSWTTGETGVTCNDDVEATIGNFDTDSAECDEHDDIFENPDCREFYDVAGYIHYRDWSLTVTVNDACTSYRKTDIAGLNEDSDNDGVVDNLRAADNCTDSGGYFDETLATCRYYGYSEESNTCSANAAGCREYTGGRSRNSRVVLQEQFEDGDLTLWEAATATDVTYSNESVATDGHSLASIGEPVWSYLYDIGTTVCAETVDGEGCASPTDDGTLGGDCTVDNGEQYCGTLVDELYTGKTYTLSFWAKGNGDLSAGFAMDADPAAAGIGSDDPTFGTVALSASSWEEYQLGPLNIDEDDYAAFGDDTVLVFEPAAGVSFYVDNIVLREGEDNITVIKDSWVTPAECDEGPDGTSSPQYYLGCQEYTTQESEVAYLKSFSSLCAEDVVGCTAYFGTHESESPYAEVYGATCSSLTGVVSVATSCYKASASATTYDTDSTYLCTIGVGQSTCTFDIDGYIPTSALADTAYNMTHLSYSAGAHVVPADTSYFLVVDDEDECAASTAGCTEFGLPTFSADRQTVSESTSVYLMNTPEEYEDILCSHEDLFCAEWDAGEAGVYYFKDPQDQTCEYRTDVTVSGSSYDGWFRADTDNFCYGTCTAGGNACSSDADCSSGDTCDASVGSYVIGGDQSGLWRNGDDSYSGWVGTCSEPYNGCSEFDDVLDITEGELYGSEEGSAYYYLDNDNLEETTLTSAQKCNGQVSQKKGCALFLNTTETTRDYNASASYVASEHADELFGDAPFALVDPIDCDNNGGEITAQDGTVVDLCSNRCQYDNALLYDLGTPYTDTYSLGASCYTADDCTDVTSESGEFVAATCGTATELLENDTNRVLKVDRDRQCSEWLSCSDTQTVWDETSASYKTVCGDVSLCNEYSSDGNASFCSSWVDDSVAAVLDVERYADRDVSWYGDDYSGYAIPDAFPVELFTQVNVAAPPGYCDLSGAVWTDGGAYDYANSAVHGSECTSTGRECEVSPSVSGEECVIVDDPVYDLVYNAGSCDESYGVSCTVGFCQNTGEACSTTDDCGTDEGSCVVGTCYDVVIDSTCSADSDCTTGFSCLSGTCVDELGDLDVAYATCDAPTSTDYPLGGYAASTGTLTLYDSVLTKAGACVRDLCLLTSDGTPYDVRDLHTKECRGYPEQDSPFANEIVEEWRNPDPRTDSSDTYEYALAPTTSDITTDADLDGEADNLAIAPDLVPYNFVTGFEQVKSCVAGEDCVCSYDKVTYGETAVRYYEDASSYPEPEGEQLGICVGGNYDGTYCSRDGITGLDTISEDRCEDTLSGGGVCSFATRKDTVVGFEGYCLERDTGINTNGNRDDDHRACLTWLPVDQLVGSTDIYAKFLGAGYFEDSYVCTDVQPFADLMTSSIPEAGAQAEEGDIACAESGEGTDVTATGTEGSAYDTCIFSGDCDSNGREGCFENAACPDGYWILMGQPAYDASDDSVYADACDGDGVTEVNDCPYVCVPYGAYTWDEVDDSGNPVSCDPTGSDYGAEDSIDEGEPGWYISTLLTAAGDTATGTTGSADDSGWDLPSYSDVYLVGKANEDDTDHTGELEFNALADGVRNCVAVGAEYTDDMVFGEGQVSVNAIFNFPSSTAVAAGDQDTYCVYDAGSCTASTEAVDCGSGSCVSGVCEDYSGTCTEISDCGANALACIDASGYYSTDGYRSLFMQADTYVACKETTQVSESEDPYRSYVWTDRLLNLGEYEITGATSTGLAYESLDAPLYYGMTVETPSARTSSAPPFQVAVCQGETTQNIYLPDDPNECPSGYTGTTRSPGEDRVEDPSSPEARSWIDFTLEEPASYTTNGTNRSYGELWTVSDVDTFSSRLNQVFAYLGFGYQYTWGGNQVNATEDDADVLGYDTTDVADDDTFGTGADVRTEGNPPTVWALDLAHCEGDACEEGDEGALTLNADSYGDQTADEFFRAYLKFYAAADKNQLPIRRVIVDWQDDTGVGSSQQDLSGSSENNNFYKNHRGLQDGSGESMCTLATEWGLTGESCQGDYFDYSNIYTCSAGTINALQSETDHAVCTYDSEGYVTNSPCVDDGACVFRPRVHIRDNWGWCTGVCTAGDDGEDGCFEGSTTIDGRSVAADFMDNTTIYSECNYITYPSSGSSLDNDPWVYYDGNIIVTP